MKILFAFILGTLSFIAYPQIENTQPTSKRSDFKCLFSSRLDAEVACYRIPAIVTAPNGDLIAAVDERVPSCGDLKWNKNINIVIRRSSDNGNSWTEIEPVVDYPIGKSASDPSMIVDHVTNTIFLFYNFMDLDKEKNIYYLKFVKSIDNGKTWSKPIDITSQVTKPDWYNDFKFITSGRGFQTNDGRLLHTLVNIEKGLYVFESTDHGNTWQLIDNPITPADESKIIELDNGTWMINSRVNNKGHRFVHISTEEGSTWFSRPDLYLIDPGCNASLVRYSSVNDGSDRNRLLFANARSKNERRNMTLSISYDEGKTWSKGKTVYAGSSAYSSITILSNGDIGLFFEKDDYQELVFVCLSIDWLTNGADKYKKGQKKSE